MGKLGGHLGNAQKQFEDAQRDLDRFEAKLEEIERKGDRAARADEPQSVTPAPVDGAGQRLGRRVASIPPAPAGRALGLRDPAGSAPGTSATPGRLPSSRRLDPRDPGLAGRVHAAAEG